MVQKSLPLCRRQGDQREAEGGFLPLLFCFKSSSSLDFETRLIRYFDKLKTKVQGKEKEEQETKPSCAVNIWDHFQN